MQSPSPHLFFIDGTQAELESYVFDGRELQIPEEEWKQILNPEAHIILREKGTERAFTGRLYRTRDSGLYRCGGCGMPLFESRAKYDSRSGWPSFFEPIKKPEEPQRIKELHDHSHGMIRIEIQCARCGSHLGHVFPDGPMPTGLRYCVNSASLSFTPSA